MSFVILSMHGAGSSLVSSILDALDVNMNYNPNAKVRWYLNYEDKDFVRLNIQIFNHCGANWRNPPSIDRIQELKSVGTFDDQIKTLIETRQGKWGFKDPRTAITIPLIHPFLNEPYYIRVNRSARDIAQSMIKRGTKSPIDRWIKLAHQYHDHIDSFLADCDSSLLEVSFDKLLDRAQSTQTIQSIASFVDSQRIQRALRRIDYKKGS